MVSKLTLHFMANSLLPPAGFPKRRMHKPKNPCVLAVVSRPASASGVESSSSPSTSSSPSSKNVYVDNWFDHFAINHLSKNLQSATGVRSRQSGYEGLIEVAVATYRRFSPSEQKEVVIRTLETAFPTFILNLAKIIIPQSKSVREFCAVFTTIFFAWLVGPVEVRESEFDGRIEKNVAYIKKCRFLEGTNCVGMCTNLCKMPTQFFIKDALGMPVNMVPNFEEMSCEMIFGQEPPLQADDPAFAQPCFKFCKESRRHDKNCL
ncbi:hypothetical protein M9H77_01433 [Catharanthus roseus]|uniref:Uncharacterized protein n=1 Tax=Catharanthus roseus TaxID=4058 RepID=A0ACC0C5J7_CATRO|nr:hypothetical protein M9H77_01433 [Catharanthus roseus]